MLQCRPLCSPSLVSRIPPSQVVAPSKLTNRSNYSLFKDGVEPTWEDAQNREGGKWVVCVDKGAGLDELWLYCVLGLIGESMDAESEICGGVVSVRKGGDKLAIWTKSGNDRNKQLLVAQRLRVLLQLPIDVPLSYMLHADANEASAAAGALEP